MARLTPIDYQMQVMNPMAAALKGYQAGFGQMQQLDEVRRQREADAMNRELQEMQMAQLRSKQEEAQAAQRLQADFYTGLSDGTMTIAGAREFLANPLISEGLASTINAYVSDESDDQIRGRMQDTAYLTMLERSDPDLFNAEMDRRVEAAFNANNQEQVDFLRNIRQLSDLDPIAAQSLGMQMVSGLASKLGDEGKLFQEAFLEGLKLGEPEAPLSPMGKLSADLEAGLITQEQFDAEFAIRQRADPGLQIRTDSEGNIQVSYGSDVLPFDPAPEQPKGKDSTPVRIPGRPEIVISPGQQQQAATKEFNTFAAFVAKNNIVRDEVQQALALIEAGAGGNALIRLARNNSELFRALTEGGLTAALEGRIKTIKAQIGFGELQDMRQNSPTGGAVGSLSAPEFDNLASMLGDLNIAQPEILETQLIRLVDYVTDMEVRAEQALNTNYSDIITVVTQQGEVERQTEQALRLTYDQNTGDVY